MHFCIISILLISVFQHIQEEHQKDEILQNLTQKYHSMKNDNYFKEQLLTNKTLEYDTIKNKTLQHKKELDLLLTEKNRCHMKVDIFAKSLQNTGTEENFSERFHDFSLFLLQKL